MLFRKKGLPIVIVNPSAPVGPRRCETDADRANHRGFFEPPAARVSRHRIELGSRARRGRRAYSRGGKRPAGRALYFGQRGRQLDDAAKRSHVLEEITGLPAPKIKIPYWLAARVAEMSEYVAFFTGKAPRATLAGVRMARYKMWFNPQKPSANSACRRRRPNRRSPTPSTGFARTGMWGSENSRRKFAD